eukprot:COSAG05_NODE_49_length_24373_cov_16.162561_27_plen_347_part_00
MTLCRATAVRTGYSSLTTSDDVFINRLQQTMVCLTLFGGTLSLSICSLYCCSVVAANTVLTAHACFLSVLVGCCICNYRHRQHKISTSVVVEVTAPDTVNEETANAASMRPQQPKKQLATVCHCDYDVPAPGLDALGRAVACQPASDAGGCVDGQHGISDIADPTLLAASILALRSPPSPAAPSNTRQGCRFVIPPTVTVGRQQLRSCVTLRLTEGALGRTKTVHFPVCLPGIPLSEPSTDQTIVLTLDQALARVGDLCAKRGPLRPTTAGELAELGGACDVTHELMLHVECYRLSLKPEALLHERTLSPGLWRQMHSQFTATAASQEFAATYGQGFVASVCCGGR